LYNKNISEKRKEFRINLHGIAINSGYGVVIDELNKVYGNVYNDTNLILEEFCEKGNIMITKFTKE